MPESRSPFTGLEARRDSRLRSRFGITLLQYRAILAVQGGHCGICPKTPTENGKALAVDHDHKGNHIRGLLCEDCNYKMGMMHDDAEWLGNASRYLLGLFSAQIASIVGPDHRVPARPRHTGYHWRRV